MKSRRFGILLAFIMMVTMFTTACAGESTASSNSLQRVLSSGTLTVIGSGEYSPFSYYDEDGNVVGFDVDVSREVAKRLGVKLDYVTGDWDDLINGLQNKQYDGILGSLAITDERLEAVSFTDPYYYSGAQLIVRSDSGISVPSEMTGKTIGVTKGTNFVGDAENLSATVNLYLDDDTALADLINGEIDGVITDRLVAVTAMNQMNDGDSLMLAGDVLRSESMGIALNIEDDTLLQKVNEILSEIREDGTLADISESWFGTNITVK